MIESVKTKGHSQKTNKQQQQKLEQKEETTNHQNPHQKEYPFRNF